MENIKDHIAGQFLGKRYHFVCDCLVPLDVTGLVQDYEISGPEILLLVEVGGRIIRIGLNHPTLRVEPITK